jgi:hypothetical protein
VGRGDGIEILELVISRVCELTGASGAALALVDGEQMICRARGGEPAPAIGAPVDITQGISGECVRSGAIVSSNDTQNDARVDSELCRLLGIGSIMAVPIFADYRVVGLLEIFSPVINAFGEDEAGVVERLIDTIPKPAMPKPHPERTGQPSNPMPSEMLREQSPSLAATETKPNVEAAVEEPETQAEPLQTEIAEARTSASAPSRLLYRALLGLVVAVLIFVLGYLVWPPIQRHWSQSVQASPQRTAESAPGGRSAQLSRASLSDLQKMSESGDAEAQWQLGVRYHNGEGVPGNDAEAIRWFQKAAEQGNVAAEAALGAYYWAGRGVPEDLSKAYFWSAIALAQGDENSKSRLEGLASQMTETQIAAARQQAEAWIQSHTQRAKSSGN